MSGSVSHDTSHRCRHGYLIGPSYRCPLPSFAGTTTVVGLHPLRGFKPLSVLAPSGASNRCQLRCLTTPYTVVGGGPLRHHNRSRSRPLASLLRCQRGYRFAALRTVVRYHPLRDYRGCRPRPPAGSQTVVGFGALQPLTPLSTLASCWPSVVVDRTPYGGHRCRPRPLRGHPPFSASCPFQATPPFTAAAPLGAFHRHGSPSLAGRRACSGCNRCLRRISAGVRGQQATPLFPNTIRYIRQIGRAHV